jgi:hypothetical protein
MRQSDKFIAYSSIFALFTEDFSFNFIVDIKLFYVIILINTVLLIYNRRFSVNKNLFLILFFFVAHGIIMSILIDNIILSLIAQIFGISISSFFYYSLLKAYGKNYLFELYLKFAYGIAFIAIPMLYLRINVFKDAHRLNGILTEPAHYAAIMLPALYVFLRQKKHFKYILIATTIIMAKSSIGFLGLLLIIVAPMIKFKYLIKYLIVLLVVLTSGVYYVNSKWDELSNREDDNVFVRRIKDTYESLSAGYSGDFDESVNLSTYALLSNVFITKESFKKYPLGTGLGSYTNQYEKYYELMTPPEYLLQLKLSKINMYDANSLFLRFFVDLGMFSLFLILYFFIRAIRIFKTDDRIIQQGTFFYLILKLLREGHYFPPEFYFFLLIFLKNFDEDTTYTRGFFDG